jgi:hypothetical protein
MWEGSVHISFGRIVTGDMIMDLAKQIASIIAKELKEHSERWAQNRLGEPGKPSCFVGLICQNLRSIQANQIQKDSINDRDRVFDAFRVYAPGGLVSWNDAPGRTAKDVIELCEKVRDHATT